MENNTLDNIESIALDGIESLTDIILKNEIIEKVPIANIATSIIKTGEMIYNKNLFRQTVSFIESLNKQEISKEKVEEYKAKVFKNEKRETEEVERVLLYLNKNIDIEKSRLLAKFYASYINQEINWNKFCEFATIINQIFIDDLQIIYDIYKDEETKVVIYENYKISRLMSTGLLNNYSGAITVQELSNGKSGGRNIFEKNGLGELFVKIATKKEKDKRLSL
mgnify:CR=1 FL=1